MPAYAGLSTYLPAPRRPAFFWVPLAKTYKIMFSFQSAIVTFDRKLK